MVSLGRLIALELVAWLARPDAGLAVWCVATIRRAGYHTCGGGLHWVDPLPRIGKLKVGAAQEYILSKLRAIFLGV